MSHEVRCLRQPLNGKEPVQSQAIPCTVCVGQSGIGTDFNPITSVFYSQYHSVWTPHSLIMYYMRYVISETASLNNALEVRL